jgi:hypothetical protein
MLLFLVPQQLTLFRLEPHAGADNPPVKDLVREGRTGPQWRRAVRAYLELRAGDSWRDLTNPRHRNDPLRWEYLLAIRLLNGLDCAPARIAEPARERLRA